MKSPMDWLLRRWFKSSSHYSPGTSATGNVSWSLKHIAIIMDGNGRWANQQGMPRTAGHKEGLERVKEIIRTVAEFNIPYLTLYAFSTENWNRPQEEVGYLMQLFQRVLDNDILELMENGIQLRFIGFREGLSPELLASMKAAEESTANNSRLQLNLAINYGSRAEITSAIRSLLQKVQNNELDPTTIDEQMVDEHLWTAGIPDPDLLIRPSGEQRLSNFLLWQCAYTEFYFTPTLWPDFDRDELLKALEVFKKRDRRFGRVKGEKL